MRQEPIFGHGGALPAVFAEDGDVRAALTARYRLAKDRMRVRQSPWPKAPPVRTKARPVYAFAPGPRSRPQPCIVYLSMPGPWRGGLAAIRPLIHAVAARHRLSYEQIVGPSRIKPIVRARQECCWLLKHRLRISYPKIGQALGGRDHSTAIHGAQMHQKRIDSGEDLTPDGDHYQLKHGMFNFGPWRDHAFDLRARGSDVQFIAYVCGVAESEIHDLFNAAASVSAELTARCVTTSRELEHGRCASF